MFNKKIKQYVRFTRQERWGLLLLLGGLMGIYGISAIYPKANISSPEADPRAGESSKTVDNQHETKINYRSNPVKLGPFDPNLATEDDWISMGVPARTARTIRRYISKGGRFRRPGDLSKIWGMRADDLRRLLPHVRIPEIGQEPDPWAQHPTAVSSGAYKRSDRPKILLDINRSDSIDWESLPGIGPGYARRILRYRERLGGFIRVEQIGETYQLPDSVFQRIRPLLRVPPSHPVRTLNINTVSIDTLGRHPYGGFAMARLVIRYREQHGPFQSLEDLLLIQRVDSSWYARIHPYLRLQ